MKVRTPTIIAALLIAASAWGANNFGGIETTTASFPMNGDGSIWIENPMGNIDVIGTDEDSITFVAQKVVHGVDTAAMDEAREQTQVLTQGDERDRQFRALLPALRNARWSSSVNFIIHVP